MIENLKILELFGGIGGFAYGIEKAVGKKNYEIVGYYDIDKYATAIFNYNFKTKYQPTDIREVDENEIPRHNLLCAGFPCQPFSIAGKRRGFEDTRGTLFFEIARILQAKKPPYFILENVKGLLSIQKGKAFKIILQTLDELGYDLQWMVLNSKFFGVPQNRERVFIIGNLRGKSRPEILPFRENAGEVQGAHYSTFDSKPEIGQANRVYFDDGVSPPLNVGWTPKVVKAFVVRSRSGKQVSEVKKNDATNTLASAEKDNCVAELRPKQIVGGSQGIRIYDSSGLSITLSSGQGGLGRQTGLYMVDDMKIRKLTPIECERLQGFPDNWTKYGYFVDKDDVKEISDTQRYKVLGNAVTVNVVEAIIKKAFSGVI